MSYFVKLPDQLLDHIDQRYFQPVMMARVWIFSVQVLSMIYCCHAELNTVAFQSQMDSLANDILGVSKFQVGKVIINMNDCM